MTGAIPRHWDGHRVSAMTFLALLPPLIATVLVRGQDMITAIGIAVSLSMVWSFAFAILRRSTMNWHSPVIAITFLLLLPVETPNWQLVISLSFGLVFGDLIFGDRGRGFLNAAVVGLAFLLFSFPAIQADATSVQITIATAISGVFLLVLGLISWRIVAGFGIGIVSLMLLLPTSENWQDLQNATIMIGLVFLIGDPVAGASTHLGRWLYGALAGALVVLLGQAGSGIGSLSSVVFSAFLASLFAPLFDQVAVYENVWRRQKRQTYEP